MLALIRDIFYDYLHRATQLSERPLAKCVLGTSTQGQIKALSQITENIIKFWITLNPVGVRTLGHHKKIEALHGVQKFVHTSENSLGAFGIGDRIMEKLVLVTYGKYQRLLGAQSTKHSIPDSTTPPKRKTMPKPPPGKRDTP